MLALRLAAVAASLALLGAAPAKKKAGAKPKKPAVEAPAGPGWLAWKPSCRHEDGQRDFVAVGRSGESGTPEVQGPQAEDDARQHLGEAIAAWQERTLRCAKKGSESKVTATSNPGHGLLSVNLETATAVSLYQERVEARAPEGKCTAVLMKHDLASMMAGIATDSGRSDALKEAVRLCGKQAFEELSALP
jgi:hypothetical protein